MTQILASKSVAKELMVGRLALDILARPSQVKEYWAAIESGRALENEGTVALECYGVLEAVVSTAAHVKAGKQSLAGGILEVAALIARATDFSKLPVYAQLMAAKLKFKRSVDGYSR